MQINNQTIIELAQNCGFDLIGFAEAKELDLEIERLNDWLSESFHAGMEYMTRNLEKRKDVRKISPSAKSIISLGMNYYTPEKHTEEKNKGKISRYAWGKDYHAIIRGKLDKLINDLKERIPSFEATAYVDTGPVMDKVWAVRSGLGWMGKHTNVINKEIGSWFFIANIITNWEFDYIKPIEDFCGSCTACIDACPTNAIVNEYVLDSNKCISYLTIENKKEIPEEFRGKLENWIFGCDICQEVCPWNRKFSTNTSIKEFYSRIKELAIDEVLKLDGATFKKQFAESPMKRSKLSGIKRNAEFLLEKKGQVETLVGKSYLINKEF